MLYAFSENFVLPFSHDEVVYGKRAMVDKIPGDRWQKHATLRALYGFMFGHPGKKLLFMGDEIGQWREWDHDGSVDWHLLDQADHAGLQRWVRDLNAAYQREPSLHQVDFDGAGFSWIDCQDHDTCVFSFLRRARDPQDFTVAVVNFTPVPRPHSRLGVPESGWYREVLNSDAEIYGGSNTGNRGGVPTEAIACHGLPFSIDVVVPPLGFVLFKRDR
jgi:1,4-alpha-glucan branching enzyme